jgi:catechol 2,3-dioxygenase-like lactoylglutathione lyase family enzyme
MKGMVQVKGDYSTGIQHIGIPTKDFPATKAFYEKLGFVPAYETEYEGSKVSFMKLGNLTFEIYESDNPAQCIGGIEHAALDVKDIEQTFRDICAMGMNNMNDEIHYLPYWDRGVKFFTIKGPNEEKIEFSQYL